MTDFEQALRERLKKLDADYKKHRDVLLNAIAYERGTPAATAADVKTPTAAIQAGGPPPPPRPIEMLGMSDSEAQSQLMIVFAAANKIQGQFDKDAVRKKLEESELRSVVTDNTLKNVSSFLWRLHKDKMINIIQKGQGHRQSIYEIAPNP